MLENIRGHSRGSIPPLRMPSPLPHDLCHEWNVSRRLPAQSPLLPLEARPDSPRESGVCQETARVIPLLTKVIRKEAQHTQRRDRASGVLPDILEHLPPKNQSLPTLLLCALTSDFTGGCPPPPSRSLCQRANLQLQLIKFLGN